MTFKSSSAALLLAAAVLAGCGSCGGGASAPPTIKSFTATPAVIATGASTKLSWDVSGADSLEIDNGVGSVAGKDTTVKPGATTTYKLTAKNSKGSVDATTRVEVSAPPAKFKVDGLPAAAAAGATLPFTVTAVDSSGNPAPIYAGKVHFSSDDTLAEVPADYSYVAADKGAHGFTVTFKTSGKHFLTAQDTATATLKGVGGPVDVSAGAAATLAMVSGDGQTGGAGVSLADPLVVRANDTYGNPVAGVAIAFAAASGGGSVNPASAQTAADGTASTVATLSAATGAETFTASAAGLAGSPVTFSATAVTAASGLEYTDPPAGGKIRLVKNPGSTSDKLLLDLVAAVPLTGYSVGFDLPLADKGVKLSATPMVPGTVLNPGTGVVAAKAALPSSGPYAGMIVSGQSQKASGAGAVATDASIGAGDLLYTLQLEVVTGSVPGVVFDGQNLGPRFRAALRDKAGNEAVAKTDFAIGKLVLK